MTSNRCYCGSQRLFSRCCEPYLLSAAVALTAEVLMRSRYSSFCTGHVDYLLATHHPSASSSGDREGLLQTIRATEWLNLLVIDKQKGQKKDTTGVVEFVAAYRSRLGPAAVSNAASNAASNTTGNVAQLHERSKFVREKGFVREKELVREKSRWFYLEGEILPPYQPKRSHPCWCGSGKPFKHCHG
ncbi:MAG: YchJ family metal-binding protein [Phormidesmis sp.]